MLLLLGGIVLSVGAFASPPYSGAQGAIGLSAPDAHTGCCKNLGVSAAGQSGCNGLAHCDRCVCGFVVAAAANPVSAAPVRSVLHPLLPVGRSKVFPPVPQRPPIVFRN